MAVQFAPIALKMAKLYVSSPTFRAGTNAFAKRAYEGFKNNFAKLTEFAGNTVARVSNTLSAGRPAFRMN